MSLIKIKLYLFKNSGSVEKKFGKKNLYYKGLVIKTTLDTSFKDQIERLKDYIQTNGGPSSHILTISENAVVRWFVHLNNKENGEKFIDLITSVYPEYTMYDYIILEKKEFFKKNLLSN